MSISAIAWTWQQRGLTPAERLTLLALADYTNRDGVAWPSNKSIAAQTELHPMTVRRARQALVAKGLIRVEARQRSDGSDSSNIYTIGEDSVTLPPSSVTLPQSSEKYRGPLASDAPHEPLREPINNPIVSTAKELLAVFSADEWATIRSKWPGLDYEHEAMKCVVWCQEHNKPIKGPKSRYYGWLDTAMKSGQNGKAAATQPSAVPDPDPTAKYKEFAERWKQH
jgi:hypothetical protein